MKKSIIKYKDKKRAYQKNMFETKPIPKHLYPSRIIFKFISYKIGLLFFVILFSSCDIVKKSAKTKSDTNFNEQIETKTFRKGDTVTYEVPNVIFKDTTIYRKNVHGTTLRLQYDSKGNMTNADCFSSFIEEIKKENRDFQQSIKDKEKEKEEKANFDWLLYIVIGVVFIGTVLGSLFLFLMYKSINKNAEILNKFLPK